MASATPAHSPFSAALSSSRRRKSPPRHHHVLSPLTTKPTSNMPLTASHRSVDIITCKATEVSQPSSLTSASSGEDGKNWVPVVPLSALPKGERRVIIQDNETILLLWYKDDIFAIENRSPAEGAYSEGLLNAKLTQDGCIVCPTTDSTFDLRTGEIKDWYPKNPVLRVLTPPLRALFVYPVKTDGENIFISLEGGIKSDASTEIVFSGKAQPGFTATDVNVDEVRMVIDEDLEGFGFTGKNELINGKAAIIGLLVLLDFELLTDDRMCKAEMLKARKNKKTEIQSSGIVSVSPKLGISEKKMPTSPELNLERRKKWAHSGASFEAELSEYFPLQSRDKGKGPIVELGDSPPISPTPLKSQKAYNFGDSLMQPGSGPAACYLLHHLLPEVDLPLVQQTTDQEVDERMTLGLHQDSFWAAERASRATKTREICASSRKDMEDICSRHAMLTQRLQTFADRTAVEKASLIVESKYLLERAELAEQKAQRVEMAEQEKDRLELENLILQRQVIKPSTRG